MERQSHPTFSSIDNKRRIWGLLVDSAYFKGFPTNQKDMVKRVLDSVVHEVSQTPGLSGSPIGEKNNEVIRQMLSYRDLWSQDGTIGGSSGSGSIGSDGIPRERSGGGPSYVTQVTAEELREQREASFNQSLREKQAEMEGYLRGSRPQNIDFSDKKKEERIGGDMERMVAEAEAERRRQMDALFAGGGFSGNADAERWVNGGRPIKIDDSATLPIEAQPIPSNKKTSAVSATTPPSPPPRRVRFSENTPSHEGGDRRRGDDDIFAKLKRRPSADRYLGSHEGQDAGNQHRQYMGDTSLILGKIGELQTQMMKMARDIETLTTVINSIPSIPIIQSNGIGSNEIVSVDATIQEENDKERRVVDV